MNCKYCNFVKTIDDLYVKEVNFTATELITENYFIFRKIGKICYIYGYCQVSSISNSPTLGNILGTLSVKPITNIRDTIAVSDKPWNAPESIQYALISTNEGQIDIHSNTNYQSKCLYGSFVFVCK